MNIVETREVILYTIFENKNNTLTDEQLTKITKALEEFSNEKFIEGQESMKNKICQYSGYDDESKYCSLSGNKI